MSVENWTWPHASTGTLSMSWMRALWASVGSSARYAFPTSFSYDPERPNDIPPANGSRRVISTRTTPCGGQDAFEAAGAALMELAVSRPAPATISRSLLRSPSLPPAAFTRLLFIRLLPFNSIQLWFGTHLVPEPAVVVDGDLCFREGLAVGARCQRHDLPRPVELGPRRRVRPSWLPRAGEGGHVGELLALEHLQVRVKARRGGEEPVGHVVGAVRLAGREEERGRSISIIDFVPVDGHPACQRLVRDDRGAHGVGVSCDRAPGDKRRVEPVQRIPGQHLGRQRPILCVHQLPVLCRRVRNPGQVLIAVHPGDNRDAVHRACPERLPK